MSLPPSRIPIGQMDARQYAAYASSVNALPTHDAKTYTPTSADYVGWSVNPTGSFRYINAGAFVIMWVEADMSGTSNLGGFAVVPLPQHLRPSVTVQVASSPCLNDGLYVPCMAQLTTGGTLAMFNINPATGAFGNFWTASGVKGWPSGFTLMYPLAR